MPRRRWNFSVLQLLLLLTALCGLCAGVVVMSRQTAGRYYLQNLQFSPNGRWLAACYSSGEVRVWDLDRKRLGAIWRQRLPADDPGSIDLSETQFIDNKTLVALRRFSCPQRSDEVVFWDIHRQDAIRTIPLSPEVLLFAIAADGTFAATLNYHGNVPPGAPRITIRLWNLVSGQLERTFTADDLFHELEFSADGTTLIGISWGADNTIQTWETTSGDTRLFKPGLSFWGYFVLSRDGKRVATVNSGFSTVVWDLENGFDPPLFHCPDIATKLQFSADDQLLIACTALGESRVWDLDTNTVAEGFPGSDLSEARRVTIVGCSPDGRWIATGSENMISLWDARTFAHVADLYRD